MEEGKKLLVYLSKSSDCYENLPLEEYFLKNNPFGCDIVYLYQNANTIVIGKNQNIYEEVNLDAAGKLRCNLFRRLSGGGAVYQDLGNLNFSFITSKSQSYEVFSLPIIEFLRQLGDIEVRFEGRNDILVNGAKVSGAAQFFYGDRVFHHGTLLYDVSLKHLAKVLKPNRLKLESKGIQSTRQRVTNIKAELGAVALPSAWSLAQRLVDFFAKRGATIIPDEEIAKIKQDKLYQEYRKERSSKGWIFGKNPQFSLNYQTRYGGGYIKVGLEVRENKIADLDISGDFLSSALVDDVVEALIGVEFEEERIKEVLSNFNLEIYFGKITLEELVNILVGKSHTEL